MPDGRNRSYPELSAPTPDSAQAARIYICNQYENGYAPYGWIGGAYCPHSSIYYYNTDTVDILKLYGDTGRAMNYEKAAMMINSLRFTINNDSLFFLGLKNYQTLFAGGTATANDLIDAMENTVQVDLTQFFNQWFYGYGFPVFNIYWNQGGNQLALKVVEQQSDSLQTPLFQTPVEIQVQRVNSDTTIRVNILQDTSYFQVYSDNADSIIGFVVDPNQWILNGPGIAANDTSIAIIPTGIQTVRLATGAITIFPNPASSYLNIRSNLPYSQSLDAALFNGLGQTVLSQKIKANDTLNLQNLPAGVYILQINQLYTYKVVVAN